MASPVPLAVRLVTEVGTRGWLRIYWGRDCMGPYFENGVRRPATGPSYHNAESLLGDKIGAIGDFPFGHASDYGPDAPWPKACDKCGRPVPPGRQDEGGGEGPHYQVFTRRIFDTPERLLAPGDMFWAEWHHHPEWTKKCSSWDNCDDPRGHLTVVLPNGRRWDIDSRASNCTMPQDRLHRCWVRHGEPPAITVDKQGRTCGAGAGSIQAGDWHGFLRAGRLVT